MMTRAEIRRAYVRAFAKAGIRVPDAVIDEMVEQIGQLHDFYEQQFARLKAEVDAAVRRELAACRAEMLRTLAQRDTDVIVVRCRPQGPER